MDAFEESWDHIEGIEEDSINRTTEEKKTIAHGIEVDPHPSGDGVVLTLTTGTEVLRFLVPRDVVVYTIGRLSAYIRDN